MLKHIGAATLALMVAGCGANGRYPSSTQMNGILQSLGQQRPQQPYIQQPAIDNHYTRFVPPPDNSSYERQSGRPVARRNQASVRQEQVEDEPTRTPSAEPSRSQESVATTMAPGCKKVPKTVTRLDGTQVTTEETECPISFGR